MKTLYVVRHAKSSWDNPDLADYDRPLNSRGKKDAPRMGKRLKERDIHPDLMITSPAARALATCLDIAAVLGYKEDQIRKDERLYHADEDTLLGVIGGFNNNLKQVMLFGHNPGLTDFVNELLNENIDNVPTCGVVSCKLHIKSWSEISWGCGKLSFFDFPKKYKED